MIVFGTLDSASTLMMLFGVDNKRISSGVHMVRGIALSILF